MLWFSFTFAWWKKCGWERMFVCPSHSLFVKCHVMCSNIFFPRITFSYKFAGVLYVFWYKPFVLVCIINIFSQSVTCLFYSISGVFWWTVVLSFQWNVRFQSFNRFSWSYLRIYCFPQGKNGYFSAQRVSLLYLPHLISWSISNILCVSNTFCA